MPYLLYFPGHTRWGWKKALNADALLDILGFSDRLPCEGKGKPPPACAHRIPTWLSIPSCCTHPAYFPFGCREKALQVCDRFVPVEGRGLWIRKGITFGR
ncbi:MAG: hypothetical protein N2170_03315 [Bacteroidia bacterium]|nr:hypothetical protein [Bacteroidia bacterium]